jgi:hypothetical protein
MKLLAFAALLGVASAACPNQCSGHGYCDENDRCKCYKATGTKAGMAAAYTGADCSLRMCPFGKAHDYITDATKELLNVNYDAALPGVAKFAGAGHPKLKAFLNNGFLLDRDIGVDVRVVSVNAAQQTAKFAWKLDTEKTFNKEEELSLATSTFTEKKAAYHIKPSFNGGKSTVDTGLYIYFELSASDFTGNKIAADDRYYLNVTHNEKVTFAADDLNTAHGVVECSGRGSCDRATGSCKCVDGYTGDACQRTACPNDCSGHGTCQSQFYFVNDAIAAANLVGTVADYNAYDAQGQMGCKCDVGFRGADCSQIECPSGADPLKGAGGAEGRDCSGRGLCDYTTGLCSCFKGFFGERCEEITNLQ